MFSKFMFGLSFWLKGWRVREKYLGSTLILMGNTLKYL